MKKISSRLLILFICTLSSLPILAQDESLSDLLSCAKTCFENGEYQKARQYIVGYAAKDGDKQIASEISSKCKSCEEYLNNANKAYIEGDLQTAEQYYLKLKALNPKHPNLQALIDKCQNIKDTKVNSAPVQQAVVPVAPTTYIIDSQQGQTNKSSRKSFKSFLFDNDYCYDNKNRYIAWGIVGTGYPWNLISSIEYRFGGIMGLGLYGDIGMDFTRITVEDDGTYAHCTKTTFRYAGGIKIYPYKGLFLDFGYGSIAPATEDVKYYGFYSWDSDDKEEVRKMVSTGHGPHLHIGYNLVTNLSKGYGFFLGLNGGFAYDTVNKKTVPSFNFKMGIAWGH